MYIKNERIKKKIKQTGTDQISTGDFLGLVSNANCTARQILKHELMLKNK
jgi:hypothetical protein